MESPRPARPTPPQTSVLQAGSVAQALRQQRQVWFAETGFIPTPIYDREKLPVDTEVHGPCIVEQMDTTTVVPPQATLRLDALGYLHMHVEPFHVHVHLQGHEGDET